MSLQLKTLRNLSSLLLILFLVSCGSNNPYTDEEQTSNIYYSTFTSEPKHLDPARSYSADEYEMLGQVYEPLYQYHFLKRPFVLIPGTAEAVAQPVNEGGKSVYTIKLKKGTFYQNHAAFASENGKYIYHDADLPRIEHPNQLPKSGKIELTAADYVYQIKRMANPLVQCPILPILAKYIDGFTDYYKMLRTQVAKIRAERRKKGGAFYNQEKDEKFNPIYIDLRKFPLRGVRVIDRYTLQIVLRQRYPQMKYWLAMPFFSPIPWQVDKFYRQPSTASQNITLDRFPVGTGAFKLSVNQPNFRMVLERNENYHEELYPSEGSPGDKEKGLLADAGKKLPFLEKAVYVKEIEFIPRWNKFLQGYYDVSAISSDVFDSAISLTLEGATLSESMKEQGIRLLSDVLPSTFYYAFNMLDETVGTLGEKQRKLRQAISIAFDIEEFIQIFMNGRGNAAHGPIPPGLFGFEQGRAGINPVVYDWNEKLKQPKRKSIEVAKKLLAEAGYPNGIRSDGKKLVLSYDTVTRSASENNKLAWTRAQFAKLNIQLQIRDTDYNQFREKVSKGNYQILGWGWNADYPDPENFLFLLYGPNGKVKSKGENAANYDNPVVNALFKRVENMPNSPERLALIKQINTILQKDAPWVWGFHPIAYALYHSWYHNAKPMAMGNNTLKYKRVNAEKRAEMRQEWNSAILWPVILTLLAFFAIVFYAGYSYRKADRGELR